MAVWAPPSENTTVWTPGTAIGTPGVGVPGGLWQYLAGGVNDRATTGNVLNILDFGADPTGESSSYAAMEAASAEAVAGDVIYMPAGRFVHDTGAIASAYRSNITLRGAGDATTVFLTGNNMTLLLFNSPGGFNSHRRSIMGTKTRGTTVLGMANTSSYTVGGHVLIHYENETDEARIIAGAEPIWSSNGGQGLRAYLTVITAVSTNTSITVMDGLPADGTNLEMWAMLQPFSARTTGWGVEDFILEFETEVGQQPILGLKMDTCEYSWVHNVKFRNWQRASDSGSPIKMELGYRNDIRRCEFHALAGSSDDGAIQTTALGRCHIEDNIITGHWDLAIYDNGGSIGNVCSYNYAPGFKTLYHGAHQSLNLIEGNILDLHHADGYHGSSSRNVFFRNWCQNQFALAFNRFNRYQCAAANLFISSAGPSYIATGNPNIGNGSARGFAGPTGTSTAVGEVQFHQEGYGINEYVIQPEDIFEGDFWDDWNAQGELITRTSATVGVFTVNKGYWTPNVTTGAGYLNVTARWGTVAEDFASGNGTVTAVDGLDVSVTFGSGTLPDVGTVVRLFTGATGYQEKDLDVAATMILAGNRYGIEGGGSEVRNSIGADTFPKSLIYGETKPDWMGSYPFPVFDPDNAATADETRLPAGDRYLNGIPPSGAALFRIGGKVLKIDGKRILIGG
jgi:hypothetical protein